MTYTKDLSTSDKALRINLDKSRYGTFAEIGAGQEVARHFFQAGKASQTVAKSMSAYDMTFSDEIYGREEHGRYVCESRLNKMLEKEYELVQSRLSEKRGDKTCFFAFANTVATSSKSRGGRCHGWMGVRFQTSPQSPPNSIVMHVNMLDNFRLQQQEALGVLGTNILHAAFYNCESVANFVGELIDSINSGRIDIDMIKFSGPNLKNFDNRLLNLELLKQNLTSAIVFNADGVIEQAAEILYSRPVLLQRGTFRPITKTNIEILEHGLQQMKDQEDLKNDPLVLMEISFDSLQSDGQVDTKDFLDRIDTITSVGYSVLVSNLYLHYQLKTYLRKSTSEQLNLVIGATNLEYLFDEKYYEDLEGGLMEAFARLIDDKTKLSVFPFKDDKICLTSQSFNPGIKYAHLYKHLTSSNAIQDVSNCDDIDTSLHSSQVRTLLQSNDPQWLELVPKSVRELIIKNKLFGYKGS